MNKLPASITQLRVAQRGRSATEYQSKT
jgi:hypothetical protein